MLLQQCASSNNMCLSFLCVNDDLHFSIAFLYRANKRRYTSPSSLWMIETTITVHNRVRVTSCSLPCVKCITVFVIILSFPNDRMGRAFFQSYTRKQQTSKLHTPYHHIHPLPFSCEQCCWVGLVCVSLCVPPYTFSSSNKRDHVSNLATLWQFY